VGRDGRQLVVRVVQNEGSAWSHKCHACKSGHSDLAAHAAALDSRFRGNDSVEEPNSERRGPLVYDAGEGDDGAQDDDRLEADRAEHPFDDFRF
jgi:hypothetical protein